LLALLSRSATCKRCPSKSGEADRLLDLVLRGGDLRGEPRLGECLLGDPPRLGGLLRGGDLFGEPLLGDLPPPLKSEPLLCSLDLLLDLRLTFNSLDTLLDLGLPVRDLVLALESGEPDLERVLGRPDPDFERLRLLPLSGDSPGTSGGGDLSGL